MNDRREQTLSGITVQIDRTLCIGSGNCVNLAPEVFELDASNLVTFREDAAREDAADIERERLVEACTLCPVDALIAHSEEGEPLAP